LAEAFATPVVDVSVLEAIALASGTTGKVMAALDAQRSEVFWGEYTIASATLEATPMDREAIASFADFTSLLASSAPPLKVFTPDAGLAARLNEVTFDTEVLPRPSAEDFARIAHRKFLAGIRADIETLDANYLRRSDAEILIAPKLGTASH
jgi:tRNA threonylcarbamoyladenosine biosynthesis protein TsaB